MSLSYKELNIVKLRLGIYYKDILIMSAQETQQKQKNSKSKSDAQGGKKGTNEISKLRIKARAYEQKILDASVKQIIDTAIRYEAEVAGPVPLPTEKKVYTVNRAPFIYKNAREQFEMRIHKRLIDIINPSSKVVEALSNLSLPSGVSIEVKMI